MMVLCDVIVISEHDRRRSGLPGSPLVVEYDNNNGAKIKSSKHTT